MCVRRAPVDVRDTRVVRVGIAVDAPQPLARLALGHQALGLHVARLEVDGAVREAERADVTVAVEARRPLVHRRPGLEIALHAVERAFDIGWDLTPDLAVVDVRFESRRAVEARRKHRMTPEVAVHVAAPRLNARQSTPIRGALENG